jgi:hypothetical protein
MSESTDPVRRLMVEVRSMRLLDKADNDRATSICAGIRKLANGCQDALSALDEEEYPDETVARAKHILRVALGRQQ